MRRAIIAAAALVAVGCGCTPAQMRAFANWHEADPTGAEEWLSSETGQATLDDVEPPRAAHGTALWDRIAWCESGGQWDHPPVRNSSGVYSGGLMIGHEWWPKFRGTEFAPYPYLASKAEQIIVAERIAAAVGLAAGWQCS